MNRLETFETKKGMLGRFRQSKRQTMSYSFNAALGVQSFTIAGPASDTIKNVTVNVTITVTGTHVQTNPTGTP